MVQKIYESQIITFDVKSDTELNVNATEMVKAFPGKRVNDFLNLSQTKEFIDAVIESKQYPEIKSQDDLVESNQGGKTWMNKILAYELAGWLSPKFRLWLYSTVDNLEHKDQLRELESTSRERQKLLENIKIRQDEIRIMRSRLDEIDGIHKELLTVIQPQLFDSNLQPMMIG
jgi:hypothetical protein